MKHLYHHHHHSTSGRLGRSIRCGLAFRPFCKGLLLAGSLICLPAFGLSTDNPPDYRLEPTTVVAQPGVDPLRAALDPRGPIQPIPAQDGAEILRTIPGFHVIRKGGTSGDPVFRGMSGSRLGILLDGEHILGGCGNRMDPPTAYVYPATYDEVVVLRGPQSVIDGPGMSAGVVRFERHRTHFEEPGVKLDSALTFGSFGRNDQFLQATAGGPAATLQLGGTRAESGDYRDGDGRRVHSAYQRWSANGAIGWTPHEDTWVELSGILSDGEAAYADRAMDGTQFKRQNIGLKGRRELTTLEGVLRAVEGHVYYNYIDHVMDNFSLRPFRPTAMMPHRVVSNPDRETFGGRLTVELEIGDQLDLVAGTDYAENRHTTRRSRNEAMRSYRTLPRQRDAHFRSNGWFGEGTVHLEEETRLVAGLRMDHWMARDRRPTVAMGMIGERPNPSAFDERNEWLPSGFLRLEQDWGTRTTASLGIGQVRRFPDYWELFNKEGESSLSAFHTKVERTTQVDAGVALRTDGGWTFNLSAFANRIDDYILIESNVPRGTRSATVTRNINAHTFGGELSAQYRFADHWRAETSLATVIGENRTDDRPLAQQPPLENRWGLSYQRDNWSVGGLARLVAPQTRYAIDQGNIVGQDLGRTSGFAVFSLNASWKPLPHSRITAGVDNLLDRTYGEHLSRGGAMVAGFPPPTTRVNEPGRTFWIQASFNY